MVEPLKIDQSQLLDEFGLSRRLATRVGALLSRKIGLSGLVLEMVGQMPALQGLLLEKRLLQEGDVSAALAEILQDGRYSELKDDPGLTLVEKPDGWVTIACEEELLADEGFSQTTVRSENVSSKPAAQNAPSTSLVQSTQQNELASRSSAADTSSEPAGDGDSPFTRREVARLRVEIFAAETSAQKVAALRQFVFAPVDKSELREVFLQALAESDGQLRQAAARGLHQLGIGSAFSESLLLLAQGVELDLAVSRLGELFTTADRFEVAAAAMLLCGVLRDPESAQKSLRPALEGLAALFLNANAAKQVSGVGDIASMLRQRMLSVTADVQSSFRKVFAAIEKAYPGQVVHGLLQEAEQSGSPEHRALLLDLLGGLELDESQRGGAAEMAARTLVEIDVEHRHSRFLKKLLLGSPQTGLAILAEAFPSCSLAHQRSLIRFFDNCLRSYQLSAELKEKLAAVALGALQNGPLQLRADIIETCVAARSDISHGLRREIATTLLESLRDYAQWPLSDYLQSALVGLGDAAAGVLMDALDNRRNNPDSALLANALGRIGVELDNDDPQACELAGDILRRLSKLSFSDNKIQDSLHLAMGMLASRRGVSPAVNALVMRTLLGRLEGNAHDAAVLRALGRSCLGTIGEMSGVQTLCGVCLSHLQADAEDPGVQMDMVEGEEVFTLGDGAGFYSEMIPASIEALQHVASSELVDAPTRQRLIETLLGLWNNFSGISVKWGLVNASRLTYSLGEIGSSKGCSDRQRLQIAMALRGRAGSLNVLEALAKIVSRPDRMPQMDKLAAAVSRRVLALLQQGGGLTMEDHEIYLRILLQCAERGRFSAEKDSAQLWAQIGQRLLNGARQGIAGSLQGLQRLLEDGVFPADLQEKLSAQLREFTALSRI